MFSLVTNRWPWEQIIFEKIDKSEPLIFKKTSLYKQFPIVLTKIPVKFLIVQNEKMLL